MTSKTKRILAGLSAAFIGGLTSLAVLAESQEALQPVVNAKAERVLEFDWPMIKVGTATYEEGPTGVTVFEFAKKSNVAIDVRGGGPGTVNSAFIDLGYQYPELDAIVFAGGSWYGLEATTAVASAMKDDGLRDGNAFTETPNIAMSVGSIIYDFGSRRLNEVYPDKKLAQAAFRATKPGVFPQGAHGAGRMTQSGSFFGCNAHSGQGGAYRQIGDVKIAVFSVVNAHGAVVDRDGTVPACYPAKGADTPVKIGDLYEELYDRVEASTKANKAQGQNTTINLVVTNQKMTPAVLKRLAVQVHTSMSRGLQPYASQYDGDVLYAVSTAEIEPQMDPVQLGAVASELMWDAILESVPPQPVAATPLRKSPFSRSDLNDFEGDYRFSQFVSLKVYRKGSKLFAKASGERKAFSVGLDKPEELLPVSKSNNTFMVPGRYPMTLEFKGDELIINPGLWGQLGKRQ